MILIEKGKVAKKTIGTIIYQNKYYFTIKYKNTQKESFQWTDIKMGKVEVKLVV